jgi:UDP-N-acetylmuramoyl-tripeptide--D-alanyl-D-alanine ligase
VIVCTLIYCYTNNHYVAGGLCVLSFLASISLVRKKPKKKLDFTPRAIRLYGVMILFSAFFISLAYITTLSFTSVFLCLTVLCILPSISVLSANISLAPVEGMINKRYINDATKKIGGYKNLIKIGVTGSYGKTSVKHFLGKILSEKYNVLITPGSYNTTMGVVKTIRENLSSTHEVFIAEMGAKKIGDIREICEIVNPKFGIVTAIGPQHLETFGSLENVKRGKLELIESLPADGLGFLNFDNITENEIQNLGVAKIISYGHSSHCNYSASNINYRNGLMNFDVIKNGEAVVHVETRLIGEHNISNLLGCCAIALEMNIEKFRIEKALRNIEPVQHRLEVKMLPNGITVIDDAFNSNPIGSQMALNALKRFEGKRKIIITPGMIELGAEEVQLNRAFGLAIAQVCDLVFLVGNKRTEPIQEALQSVNFPSNQLFVSKSLSEAHEKLKPLLKEGDIVLYENDLPDSFDE